MVRVNGKVSAGTFMNMYPDSSIELNMLHLHISAPESESALWELEEHLNIEADWCQEFGGVRYVAQPGLAHVIASCSVQGKFHAHVEYLLGSGRILVHLNSIGTLRPWARL